MQKTGSDMSHITCMQVIELFFVLKYSVSLAFPAHSIENTITEQRFTPGLVRIVRIRVQTATEFSKVQILTLNAHMWLAC